MVENRHNQWTIETTPYIDEQINTLCEADKKRWNKFKVRVSDNPIYYPGYRVIIKFKSGKFAGQYRYRDDPIRVRYFLFEKTNTVCVLELSGADSASHKKRSKK